MTGSWLIANSKGGSTDESAIAATAGQIQARGTAVLRVIDLSQEHLPDPTSDAPDIIACLGGDGTAGAVIDRYGKSGGPALLVLPGGTMNLLAHQLHGDASIEAIIERSLPEFRTVSLPQIDGPAFRSLVGIIAGPTTAWGEVREELREGDVAGLIEAIPVAIEATFDGTHVRIAGAMRDHAALFVEPTETRLRAHDIKAATLGDLASHGWAWLQRDFLGGPTEQVAEEKSITLEDTDGQIDLLVDGEHMSARSPLTLRHAICPARFIATVDKKSRTR
jgi:hypothetical protein